VTLNLALVDALRLCNNFFVSRNHTSGSFTISYGDIQITGGDFAYDDWVGISDNAGRLTGVYKLDVPSYLPQDAPETYFSLKNGSDDVSPLIGEKRFTGTIYHIALPMGFIELVEEIKAWREDPANSSDIVSHGVVGVYQETRANGKDGKPLTWQDKFGGKLTVWNRALSAVRF